MTENITEIVSVQGALEDLNTACVGKLYKSFKELPVGEYIVVKFHIVETAHGKRIRIDLAETYMLLPERFARALTPEKINALNKSPKIMIFNGKDSSNRDRLMLEFRGDSYFAEMFN